MTVALFGGAFDPPHLGHIQVGQAVLKQHLVDEVWYVPVYHHPWAERLKKFSMSAYADRKAMTELILPSGANLKEYLDVSYAYPTLVYFSNKYPQHQFSWIIGSEYLSSFADWKFAHQLLKEFIVYVYPRKNHPLTPLLSGMKALVNFPEVAVSSSLIRKYLRTGKSIAQLVDPLVEKYIRQHQLYERGSHGVS